MTYTGYDLAELCTRDQKALARRSDILVTGRYVEGQRDTSLRWRGSRNQTVHFPTGRYGSLEFAEANETEVTLDARGVVSVRGYPPKWLLDPERDRLGI
jgi:anaerobic ribonucleoside-triphosphate reductase activating protein